MRNLVLLFFISTAQADELAISKPWCINEMGGFAEVTLYDGTRVDCETVTHVWEVGFAPKWDDVWQAYHYSNVTGKKPGIAKIITSDHDLVYIIRLLDDLRKAGDRDTDVMIIDRRP